MLFIETWSLTICWLVKMVTSRSMVCSFNFSLFKWFKIPSFCFSEKKTFIFGESFGIINIYVHFIWAFRFQSLFSNSFLFMGICLVILLKEVYALCWRSILIAWNTLKITEYTQFGLLSCRVWKFYSLYFFFW